MGDQARKKTKRAAKVEEIQATTAAGGTGRTVELGGWKGGRPLQYGACTRIKITASESLNFHLGRIACDSWSVPVELLTHLADAIELGGGMALDDPWLSGLHGGRELLVSAPDGKRCR